MTRKLEASEVELTLLRFVVGNLAENPLASFLSKLTLFTRKQTRNLTRGLFKRSMVLQDCAGSMFVCGEGDMDP